MAETLTLFQILQQRSDELQIRLLRELPPAGSPFKFDDLAECSFLGYEVPTRLDWKTVVPLTHGQGIGIGALCSFTSNGQAEPETIRGLSVTWPDPDDEPAILAIAPVENPVTIGTERQRLFARVYLAAQLYTLTDEQPTVRLSMSVDFVATAGKGPKRFSGVERAQLQKALTLLLSLQRRDLQIPTLTRKSQKSRVPVFDPREPALVDAFDIVVQRLRLLLDQ